MKGLKNAPYLIIPIKGIFFQFLERNKNDE